MVEQVPAARARRSRTLLMGPWLHRVPEGSRLGEIDFGPAVVDVSEGIIRARYRDDEARPDPLERNEVAEFRLRLYPTSVVLRAGHRIRLDIASSNFPCFGRNLITSEDVATGTRLTVARQTVLHDGRQPSRIVLPFIPAQRLAASRN